MTGIADSAPVQTFLTLLLLHRIYSAAKPLLLNSFITVTLGCVFIGFAAQLVSSCMLYTVYYASLAVEADRGGQPGAEGPRVSLVEFLSLNVTMATVMSHALVVFLAVAGGLVSLWASDLIHAFSSAYPSLALDGDGKPVVDLRYKTPFKT